MFVGCPFSFAAVIRFRGYLRVHSLVHLFVILFVYYLFLLVCVCNVCLLICLKCVSVFNVLF